MKENQLVKIGGSILEDSGAIFSTMNQLNELLHIQNQFKNIIIITGGGSFANFVRFIDNKLNLGDDIAHWEAILSMDKNAEMLHQQFPSTVLIDRFKDLYKKVAKESIRPQLIIFQSFNYLYETDELPHSWLVTSDSIGLYISYKLGLKKCFLIKDVDGIIDKQGNLITNLTINEFKSLKNANQLANIQKEKNKLKEQSSPLDPYCLELMDKYSIKSIILNGSSSHRRIIQYFTKNKTKSTTIQPTK